MFNTDLALKILKTIEAEPETWLQRSWAVHGVTGINECGTAFCFAGHVINELGYVPAFNVEAEAFRKHSIGYPVTDVCHRPGTEEYKLIPTVAMNEFGLNPDDAETLFSPFNTLPGLKTLIAGFALKYNGETIDV